MFEEGEHMATAWECDKCGKLLKDSRGCLSFGEVTYQAGGKIQVLDDVLFCRECTVELYPPFCAVFVAQRKRVREVTT
jgi:hypothetical protein